MEPKSFLEGFYGPAFMEREKKPEFICPVASECLLFPAHQSSCHRVLTSPPFQFPPASPLAATRIYMNIPHASPKLLLISVGKLLTRREKPRRGSPGNLGCAEGIPGTRADCAAQGADPPSTYPAPPIDRYHF